MATFPLRVDLGIDGAWTNISSDVRYEQQIRITRGRSDWGQQVDASRCQLTLDNNTGNYSARNPNSPYFGKIGRNTPLRVSVGTGAVALDLPGNAGDYATTPDTAALDVTDLDVRVDATLDNWIQPDYPSSGQSNYPRTELIAKRDAAQISWALYIAAGRPYLEWSANGTTVLSSWSSYSLPLTTSGRLAVRATLDVDNGAGGLAIAFYTAPSLSGPWTVLDSGGAAVTTSIFAGTAPLRIGDATEETQWRPALGRVHAAEVRGSIGGAVVASPDFTAQTSGTTTFADSAGRTWTLAGQAEITNRKTRFVGEISSWKPQRDVTDVTTEIEAAGVLRRLGAGAVPTKSAFYREFTSPGRMTAGIVAYWPMEDGATATRLASAYSGHPSMSITGAVVPAAYADWVASDPIPTLTSGSIRVTVPPYTVPASGTRLGWFTRVPAAGPLSTQRLLSLSQTGTAAVWSVWVNTAGQCAVRAYDADSVQIHDSGFGTDSILGLEEYFLLALTTSGANVSYSLFAVDIAASLPTAVVANTSTTFSITGTVNTVTTSRITQIRVGEDAGMNGTAIGHLALGGAATGFTATAAPMVGWNGEEGSSRVSRLGLEEPMHAYATGPGDERCGPQPRGTAVDVMRTAGDVDDGILAELRGALGLRYVTRASMYNQPATLTLNYRGADGLVAPLSPADDDQSVTNDVTVSRTGGSSARVALPTGALSTQPPPAGIGLYDTAYTLTLMDDNQPVQHAGWRLYLGTWDETRYPTVTVNLANAPSSIEAAAAVDTGSRMQITNPPAWLPPGVIDLLVQGYTEVLDQFTWIITYNCAAAGPWDVAWPGNASTASARREFQWVDTDGSILVEDLTTTETDVDVRATTGPPWTPNLSDTPFDWRVSGEVMTVNAPHSLVNANPFFAVDVSDWSTENSALTRSTTYIHPHPRATASMLITPAGGAAFVGAQAGITAADSITPGAAYVVGHWVYSVDGWADIRPTISWYTSASAFISTVSATAVAVTSSLWTYVEATFVAPATAGRAQGRVRMGSTPAATDRLWVWAARGPVRAKSSAVFDGFGRTTASGWGIADSGQAWTVVGTAAEYSTNSTYGITTHPTVGISHLATIAAPSADVDLYADVAASALATGASLYAGPIVRAVDNNNCYQARVDLTTANAVVLTVRKRVAGVETQLGGTYTLPFAHVAGTFYRVRFQVVGTVLRARLWLATDREPDVWHADTTDTALTAAASVGVRCFRNTGNTNVSPELRFDNLDLISPQTYTVARSANGIVKTQTSGATVALAYPAYLAL